MIHPALEVQGASLAFGGLKVLDGIDLRVEAGTICGVIGPNGAGKTSLFNCMSGLYSLQTGKILLDGHAIEHLSVADRARLGVARTFQHVKLADDLTILENVVAGFADTLQAGWASAFLPLAAARREMADARSRALHALAAVGIEGRARDRVHSIPPGIARLVEIARAIARQPRILLLDEPAAGLNSVETAELARRLLRLASPQMSMVIVEHNMGFIGSLCNSLYVLNFGKVIACGRPTEVMKNPDVIRVYLGEDSEHE